MYVEEREREREREREHEHRMKVTSTQTEKAKSFCDILASFSFLRLLTYSSTPPPASTRKANEVQEIGYAKVMNMIDVHINMN